MLVVTSVSLQTLPLDLHSTRIERLHAPHLQLSAAVLAGTFEQQSASHHEGTSDAGSCPTTGLCA